MEGKQHAAFLETTSQTSGAVMTQSPSAYGSWCPLHPPLCQSPGAEEQDSPRAGTPGRAR